MLGEFCFISLMVYTLSANVEKEISPSKNVSALNNMNSLTDLTHYGRENLKFNSSLEFNSSGPLQNTSVLKISQNSSAQSLDKPPQYDTSGEKNDGKPIVAKKGAVYNLSDNSSNIKMPSTVKSVIADVDLEENQTVGSDIVSSENEMEKLSLNQSRVHDAENEMKIGFRSNIVLPIIAVILSIPLVFILIVVFYKRGAEWWQHRHYRRMDFLIDGMYNN